MTISDMIAALTEMQRDAGGRDLPVLIASQLDDYRHRVRGFDFRQDGNAVILRRGDIIVR